MTQKDKELLLTDLCARLPYGVKVQCGDYLFTFDKDHTGIGLLYRDFYGNTLESPKIILSGCYYGENIKPYLFPLSSMTEEQFNELKSYVDLNYEHNTLELVEWDNNYKTLEFWLEEIPSYCVIKVFDWLNKNHFDYRGLIPMGLAIDATNKNIY